MWHILCDKLFPCNFTQTILLSYFYSACLGHSVVICGYSYVYFVGNGKQRESLLLQRRKEILFCRQLPINDSYLDIQYGYAFNDSCCYLRITITYFMPKELSQKMLFTAYVLQHFFFKASYFPKIYYAQLRTQRKTIKYQISSLIGFLDNNLQIFVADCRKILEVLNKVKYMIDIRSFDLN